MCTWIYNPSVQWGRAIRRNIGKTVKQASLLYVSAMAGYVLYLRPAHSTSEPDFEMETSISTPKSLRGRTNFCTKSSWQPHLLFPHFSQISPIQCTCMKLILWAGLWLYRQTAKPQITQKAFLKALTAAEVEVPEFNNKINKEVKMFLVVLSSAIEARGNWCQQPQVIKCRD